MGPLQEQSVLLTPEPLLHPLVLFMEAGSHAAWVLFELAMEPRII